VISKKKLRGYYKKNAQAEIPLTEWDYKMKSCDAINIYELRKIFALLITQYNKVNTVGVTYRLEEETITEPHFDFENTIIFEKMSLHPP